MDAGKEIDKKTEGTAVIVTTLLAPAAGMTAVTRVVGEAPLNSMGMLSGKRNQFQPKPPTD
jgi:hypothetical protein